MQLTGGQALFDGVTIRSTRFRVAARRCTNGDIQLATGEMERSKLLETPFVRGFILWFVAAAALRELRRLHVDAMPAAASR